MANGYYAVTTTLGDASTSRGPVSIYLNGTLEASGLKTRPGQPQVRQRATRSQPASEPCGIPFLEFRNILS